MQRVWKTVKQYITPTPENTYRPHVLQKSWLVFFLVFSLTLEGFLVSSMVARQTDSFITRAPYTQQAAVFSIQSGQTLLRNTVRIMSDPKITNAFLGVIGVLVLLVVVLAFCMHIEVQSHEALAGGIVVAVIAFVLLGANSHFLTTASDAAAGIRALAP